MRSSYPEFVLTNIICIEKALKGTEIVFVLTVFVLTRLYYVIRFIFVLIRCGGIFAFLQRSIKQDSEQVNNNNRKEPTYPLRSSARVKKIKLSQESSLMDVEMGSAARTKLIILSENLTSIIDSVVFLYHTAVHHALSMSRGYFSTLNQFSKSLLDTQSKLNTIDSLHTEVISELETSRQVSSILQYRFLIYRVSSLLNYFSPVILISDTTGNTDELNKYKRYARDIYRYAIWNPF